MASLLDQEPPIMEANSSQSRLLGEQEEDQDICDCISRGEQTDSIASENSSGIMNESMAGNDAEEFHTPSQEASFWYRRRLGNTGDTATAAISREDSAAWSLFTREVESFAPSEAGEISPETYRNLRKLDTFAMWTVEVFALIISMVSFGGIVALLVAYDNEPNPGFTEVISINAIIAIFSTILKATLLFVISEGEHISMNS
ncbi:hypothetical protein CGCA056_v004039 [Colletotrichum aenigma]|uniref:uncharacterized protein n=1 Tax=Colletotrichum aenigma TaxID=1215731 RepID=UPI0018722B01|nr:uncharacterized protein CGCA056_v004039 [Colletotrichum aenigma]KAF5522953.1 hypothetical protein CGCA056_v004039 [Colletotrichum aenigma]